MGPNVQKWFTIQVGLVQFYIRCSNHALILYSPEGDIPSKLYSAPIQTFYLPYQHTALASLLGGYTVQKTAHTFIGTPNSSE